MATGPKVDLEFRAGLCQLFRFCAALGACLGLILLGRDLRVFLDPARGARGCESRIEVGSTGPKVDFDFRAGVALVDRPALGLILTSGPVVYYSFTFDAYAELILLARDA